MPTTGFGSHKFGENPFGETDFSRVKLVENLPERPYVVCDNEEGEPLQRFLRATGEIVNELKRYVDDFPELRVPDKVPEHLLDSLGADFGLEVNRAKPLDLQRAEVDNIIELIKWRGTDKGYRIIGKMEGVQFKVSSIHKESECEVEQLDPDSDDFHTEASKEVKFQPRFDEIPGDIIETDQLYDSRYLEDPRSDEDGFFTLAPVDQDYIPRCWTHFLSVEIKDTKETTFDPGDLQSILNRIKERVKPVHVEFLKITFIREMEADIEITGEMTTS